MLPPLPPSDDTSFEKNEYNSFYRHTPRSFWGQAKIEKIDISKSVKCDHRFKTTDGGVKCTICHFGLIGNLHARDGKIYHNGEPLPL